MVKHLLVMALALLIIGGMAQAAQWEIDVPHSSIGFKVSHLVISSTTGKFEKFTGSVEFDGQDVETGSVEVQINVASVNTANEDRDKHLKSPDFFDAEGYPSITFVSKKIIKGEGNKFQIVGDMTMRGKTKEVTFACEFRGSAEFMGTTKAGFSAQAVIDRQDFGVSFSKVLETGGLVVGNEVELILEFEINKVG